MANMPNSGHLDGDYVRDNRQYPSCVTTPTHHPATSLDWRRLSPSLFFRCLLPGGLVARLEKLLLVPEGARCSELDRLRRPPFTPTITGLVKAGPQGPDLSHGGAGAAGVDFG